MPPNDWRDAYQRWKDTYEAAVEILRLADMAEALGNHEVAQNHRDSVSGNLEEKSLDFLRADIPPDVCGPYADALFEIGVVVGDLLTGDITIWFRDRIISVLDTCPFELPDARVPKVPWGSKWQIKYYSYRRWEKDYEKEELQGTFKVPDLTLRDLLLGDKATFDEFMQEGGRNGTYAWIKADLLFKCDFTIETSLNGTYTRHISSYSDTWEAGPCIVHAQRTGGEASISYEIQLKVCGEESGVSLYSDTVVRHDEAVINITHTETNTCDGNVETRTETEQVRVKPPKKLDSSYWRNMEIIPLVAGSYIVDNVHYRHMETTKEIKLIPIS